MNAYCCDEFREQAEQDDVAGKFLPHSDGTWSVVGCCGSIYGCRVISEMKFCPYCGKPVPTQDCSVPEIMPAIQ